MGRDALYAKSPETVARGLSRIMRDYLIEHVKGPRPIDRMGESHRARTRISMTARGLVRVGLSSPHGRGFHAPTHTHITRQGRAVLAFLLGEYAEILCRLGYGVVAPSEPPAHVPLSTSELRVRRVRQKAGQRKTGQLYVTESGSCLGRPTKTPTRA